MSAALQVQRYTAACAMVTVVSVLSEGGATSDSSRSSSRLKSSQGDNVILIVVHSSFCIIGNCVK